MMVAPLLAMALVGTPDGSDWKTYAPKGSGIRFSMPGTVRQVDRADPTGCNTAMHSCYAQSGGLKYLLIYGDLAQKFAPAAERLWESDHNGPAVNAALTGTLDVAAKVAKGKVLARSSWDKDGFPLAFQALDLGSDQGLCDYAMLTRTGIVVATVEGPKSAESGKLAVKFVNSIDLTGRR